MIRGRNADEEKPDCVLDYNKYMGAVDRCDQMISYSNFDRRTVKWWKKVFFHILCLAVLNGYLLYKKSTQHPILQRVFRRELVKQFVEASQCTSNETRGRKVQSADLLKRLTDRHFITHLPATPKRLHAKKHCVVCLKRQTTYCCKQCKTALCVEPCFELYHTKSDYVHAYRHRYEEE